MSGPRVTDEYRYHRTDTVILENRALRVVVLPGKGTDVIELRDKRADVDVLFDAPHHWQLPSDDFVQSKDVGTAWMDHYPGGWQECLPMGGADPAAHGAEYGIHGESSLLAWDYELVEGDHGASASFATELVRYPFLVEKTLSLEPDSSTLKVEERLTNDGKVELPYIWLHHLAYGPPILGEEARIDLAGATVTVDETPQGESPLTWGETFDWPRSADGVDMRQVPAPDAGIHDLSYLHDLAAGWYALTNPEIDLGVAVSFDENLFESVWCWRAAGGFDSSPFFGREYVQGLELCTGWPSSDLPDSQGPEGTRTLKTLEPGETVETAFEVTTYRGQERVESYESVR